MRPDAIDELDAAARAAGYGGGDIDPATECQKCQQHYLMINRLMIALIEIGSRYRFEASRFRKIKPKGDDRMIPRKESVPA